MLALTPYLLYESGACLAILAALFFILPKEKAGRNKERSVFADFAKGAAIISIVSIHASGRAGWGAWANGLIWFGVPVFIILSGYLLARRYGEKIGLGNYYWKTFLRVFVPYALFTLLMHLMNNGWSVNLQELALDIALGRANGRNLYFIPVILQLYLLYPIIAARKKFFTSPVVITTVLVISLVLGNYHSSVQQPEWDSDALELVFFGRYAFYFLFGIWISGIDFEKMKAAVSAKAAFACAIPIGLLCLAVGGISFGYLYPVLWLFALHLLYLALKKIPLAAPALKFTAQLGAYSLAVYLLHTPVIYTVAPLLSGLGGPAQYAVFLALSLIVGWSAGKFVMPYYYRLVGLTRASA